MKPLYTFVINPKSGSRSDAASVRQLKNYLIGRDCRVKIYQTQSLEHAAELARKAVEDNAEMVIAAGGDGTIRHVAEGLADSNIPILIVPTGTENLLAREINLDGTVDQELNALTHGHLRNLDLGMVNGRCFISVVGVGFDAETVRRVHGKRRSHITHMSYVWPICRTFWEYQIEHVRVEADGRLLCDEPALVFVSNNPRYAVGLQLTPDADTSDGLLDLCIYKCANRWELIWHSILTLFRLSQKFPRRVIRTRCRQVHISSDVARMLSQVDGDPGPPLPLKIEVMPARARLLAPPEQGKDYYYRPRRMYHLRRWLFR